MVRAFREGDTETPIVLMGYYNPIYSRGVERFLTDAAEAGIDGLIVVDLPPEEDDELCIPARAHGIDFIRLATPTTDDERLPRVLENTSGFVYYVSITGITGSAAGAGRRGGAGGGADPEGQRPAGGGRIRHPHARICPRDGLGRRWLRGGIGHRRRACARPAGGRRARLSCAGWPRGRTGPEAGPDFALRPAMSRGKEGLRMAERKTQIVVVGGGAAGLGLVRKLGAKYSRDTHDIILIERNRTHVWKPLLHEVAAGSLDPNVDEVGYGGHAARWGYRFFNGALEQIDRERRRVITAPLLDEDGTVIVDRHEIRYDWLVLAIGGVANDFGIPGVREHAMFLEDRRQADRFRQKLLNACLRVNERRQSEGAEARLPICIVGGGATGVELSAELVNSAKALRSYGLEVFDEDAIRITLLEAGPGLLPALPEEVSGKVAEELRRLGVDVRTGTMVTEVDPGRVETKDGTAIEAEMILWAAGVRGDHLLSRITDLELSGQGRIVVEPTLRTARDDRIFAIGDCAHCVLPGDERPVPPRAQSAQQMADHMVGQLDRARRGAPLTNFVYRDKGSLVSLSRFATLGSLMGNLVGGQMAIQGRVARLAYMSLYRMHLISVHGWIRGPAQILSSEISKATRPALKMH